MALQINLVMVKGAICNNFRGFFKSFFKRFLLPMCEQIVT